MVLIQIDCEKGEGIELKEKYEIKGYPTFILANTEGKAYYRWMGYTKKLLFEKLATGFSDLTTISEKEARFKKSPDASTAAQLADYRASKADYPAAVEYYNKATELDNQKDYSYQIYQNQFYGYRRELFTLDQVIGAADAALQSSNVDADDKFYVLYGMSNFITRMPENEKIRSYLIEANKLAEKKLQTEPDRAARNIQINYVLMIEKNKDKAVQLKKESMPEGWEDDAGDLNSFSWWCFENRVNLAEAEKLARRGVKLAKPGREKAMILDTCAELVNVSGNPAEAAELIEAAQKEDPDNEYYKDQLKRFKEMIKS